jgi:hypothetical protein
MKTRFTFLIVLFSIFNLFAQKYESGYYIDNFDTKIEGFIKNNDWRNNPKSFEFKKSLDDKNTTISIESCKEFNINTISKFTRAKVQIEKSDTKIGGLGYDKNPVFVEETIFLKHLVSGKNILYYYYDQGLEKFFFSNETTKVTQLIYIKFLIDENDVKFKEEYKNAQANSIMQNEAYKRQLWENVKCEQTTMNEISKLEFNKSSLQKYFSKVNTCNGSIENIVSNEKKAIMSVKAVALINSDQIKFNGSGANISFDRKVGFGFGAELELLMPFNNYKWSVFIEPSFSKYEGNETITSGIDNTFSQGVKVNTSFIQVPIGAKYYFGDSSKSAFYLGAGITITNIKENTIIDFESRTDLYFANFTYTFFGTLGYKFKQFAAEFRFNSTNNASPSNGYDIQFNRSTLALKYELFRK